MQLKTIPEDFVVVEQATHQTGGGQYILAEMTKRNMTTERSLSALADFLRVQRKTIGYAGTKDARALTKQFITIRDDSGVSERLKKFSNASVAVREVGRVQEQLRLGVLEGNHFEIVVRNIVDETITPMEKVPNYFDEQRFSTSNAEIGKHIIKGEFKEAVELLMKSDDDAQARMSHYLEKRTNDYVGALHLIPKNILLMYVHAYQSLLFNMVLREYITENDSQATKVEGAVPITVPSKELPDANIPLFGFGTELDGVFGSIYENILAQEGIEPRDFVVRAIPFLTVEGGERQAFFVVRNLTIGEAADDDIFPGSKKQLLTFDLSKGCYATMVVKCLYRVGDLRGRQE